MKIRKKSGVKSNRFCFKVSADVRKCGASVYFFETKFSAPPSIHAPEFYSNVELGGFFEHLAIRLSKKAGVDLKELFNVNFYISPKNNRWYHLLGYNTPRLYSLIVNFAFDPQSCLQDIRMILFRPRRSMRQR